jgi:Domain of unknown function (DUF4157)
MNLAGINIKENSILARIAAAKLRSSRVAMVIGNTIHLHNVTRADFLKDESWVKHELCHVRQYRQHGLVPFLAKYLWESIKKGYHNNKFEVEAREAELM